ncbi:hypothetical protein CR513_00297, partial [Mucuna pruriens]
MKDNKPEDTPIAKGDKFSLKQCPNNDLERNEMQKIIYASAMGSLMYAQVCTRPDIAFVVGVLDRYLSDPVMQHWKAVKCVIHYLRRTKGYMLTYRKSEGLEIIMYSDSDFDGCQDSKRSMFGYIYIHPTKVQNKQIFIKHIGTSFMLVDQLTKGLIPKVFHGHTAH